MSHDFLSVYSAKNLEYLLAIAYLLLFVPFWRFLQGGKRATVEARAATAPRAEARPAGATALRPGAGWFQVPSGVHLHPGHTWARLEPGGLVAVGIDDFAHKLVAPTAVRLPPLGARVAQGEPALALRDGGAAVPMLSPVDGIVVAVNPAMRNDAAALADPYGAGWLFKVKTPRLAANFRQLHAPPQANRLLEDSAEALVRRMDPELGRLLQDGGTPVHGIARALAGDDWEALAREHFRT
ncbi:MAG TPA: glycine cleavage system protein H [Anaeromyxobacter sp.]|nr:glycine cleavage system protein H [Anaeromyxobacter sp.]